MVELDPELSERVQIFQRRLYMPHHDASMFPLPAVADALLGANPTFTLVDELGVIDAEVFEAMRLASGKRSESTLLAIGTPPREPDSIMRTLVEHGRRGDDSTFALVEYSAPSTCAIADRKAWKKANPALGDFLYEDGMATEARTVRESTFRQFRLGQWVGQPDEAWMAAELWASCLGTETVPDGADVVLALDGRSRRTAPPSSAAPWRAHPTCSWWVCGRTRTPATTRSASTSRKSRRASGTRVAGGTCSR
jgi:phage terminase large subunit-like protein